MREESIAFEKLLDIMDKLRANCPWDKAQTIETLRYLTIEETYELSDAIIEKDMQSICKELGDLMLHLVFYAKIASENKVFNITDVLNGICEKLVVRHPHIFGDVKVTGAEEVKSNWEKIKLKTGEKSVLAGVPVSLPAVVKAYRIQEKVSGVGFDWKNTSQVYEKVLEELSELKKETDNQENINKNKIENEFGDLLFALVNYGRFIQINPEDALERTNKKFIKRFTYIEQKAKENGRKIQDLSLAEMDVFWNEAKKEEYETN
ncbi:MAG: nucleoside triphosphate pyrophosphohydrolase [Bacteroidales bacterium]|jgi:XTP/dITP diphosphohydrolase|nr:nucleoside triphosphate pyrophosphohydrolase [Bacteroidales bacterium]